MILMTPKKHVFFLFEVLRLFFLCSNVFFFWGGKGLSTWQLNSGDIPDRWRSPATFERITYIIIPKRSRSQNCQVSISSGDNTRYLSSHFVDYMLPIGTKAHATRTRSQKSKLLHSFLQMLTAVPNEIMGV